MSCSQDTTRRSAIGGLSKAGRAIRHSPASTRVPRRTFAAMASRARVQRFSPLVSAVPRSPVLPAASIVLSTVIDSLESAQLRRAPAFAAGDRVRVHFQVVEGTRRRTQVFEGVVIKRQGHGVRETFTVRKQSFGVGVERTLDRKSVV